MQQDHDLILFTKSFHSIVCTATAAVWKNETLLSRDLRQINSFLISLVKTLVSKDFRQINAVS